MTISYGVLSTYPPTQCGLATFSRALVTALESPQDLVGVVRVADAAELPGRRGARSSTGQPADGTWVRGEARGPRRAAAALNAFDVAVLQHEYGIFPGPDGEDVLDVVRRLRVPLVTVLHTVLVTPSPNQRRILETLVSASSAVVTMTQTGHDRLLEHYAVDGSKVTVIPHGADVPPPQLHRRPRAAGRPATVLTWGLLGEGKGIEWAVDAMGLLGDLDPRPEYHVVGQTHPKVRAEHGEVYRERLIARAAAGGSGAVHFDDRYLSTAELHRIVQAADIVLLPYDSREQVTSGVLIEAVAAGKPVVSTAFPHAVELLSSGAGLLVDRQDPAGIAAALRRVLTEPGLGTAMAAEAERIAPGLLWPAVADRYRAVAAAVVPRRSVLATA
ncbi:Glycosyltransferase involved in cell wall bisynthesis [Friedmanniella luteola]|uniref:Glycosyltransferase involved in cell wall bisynthesis n=1 Tax=Friedmanniella luteola TaxID=546871 RepID=A0A1H2A989_9ACTN|nr:glycosyltransferase [Friedmanniella luteola]SDT42424.1 Glycosyltransferase involved in cell wall bisynthesis [Friedmanniella luteola]